MVKFGIKLILAIALLLSSILVGCGSAPIASNIDTAQAVRRDNERLSHGETILVEKARVSVHGFYLTKYIDKENGNVIYQYQNRITVIPSGTTGK